MANLKTILLIDDSDADNHFHKIVINRVSQEYTLRAINNSILGLDYLTKCLCGENEAEYPLPQLIFIDINMPAMNGFDLLCKLRNVPDPNHIKEKMKIYMLTGSLNPDDKIKAMENFSDLITGFCIKPLTETVFSAIIEEHF